MRFLLLIILFFIHTIVYTQDPYYFVETAYIDINDIPNEIAFGQDGTIFLANDEDGLRAFTYNGSSFFNIAHTNAYTDEWSPVKGLVVSPSGTIFTASGRKLQAYTFTDSTLTFNAQISIGENAYAWDIALGSDGTIFLATFDDGLRAYTYNDTSFTLKAHINLNEYGFTTGIAIGPDGTIFVAHSEDGMRAYTYDGVSFTNTAHIDENDVDRIQKVAVGSNGIIYAACRGDGLRAYSYNGTSFTKRAQIEIDTDAYDLALASDGTIFVASDHNGALRAFRYNDTSPQVTFSNLANSERSDFTHAEMVAVGPDNTIFLGVFENRLFAYNYSGFTAISDNSENTTNQHTLLKNYPNPFNPVTTIEYYISKPNFVTITIYNILGEVVKFFNRGFQRTGKYRIKFDCKNLASTIYYYKLQLGNDYVQTKKMIMIR